MRKQQDAQVYDMPAPERPHMPDYGIASGPQGMLPWSWASERMARSRNYWIATVRPDGRPHVTPVWGVWLDETLYFGCARSSRKARNLAANPEVAVHLESGDETVIFEGVVEEVSDMELLTRIARANAEKYAPYSPDPDPGPGTVMYALRPRVAFAWTEHEFPKSPTRWRFHRPTG